MAKRKSMTRKASKTLSRAGNTVTAKAFIVGVLVAVVLGLFGQHASVAPHQTILMSLLVLAGLIVGFCNITPEETYHYLLAAVSLVIVSNFGGAVLGNVATVGPYLLGIFNALIAFIVPATIVVALKSIYATSKD